MLKKRNVVTVRLDNDLDEDLNKLVKQKKMSKSDLIRDLLIKEIKKTPIMNGWSDQSFNFDCWNHCSGVLGGEAPYQKNEK